ncbi:hypothetical protein [Vibrio phage H188]|nr:hypothetical protein [Vibrio phage H188]
MRVSNTKTFIAKSKSIHGDLYDYSRVEYKGAQQKVLINCRIHGAFEQRPNDHTKGQGCGMCSPTKKITSRDFADSLSMPLGVVFVEASFKSMSHNVEFICSKHGSFSRWPNSALTDASCRECEKDYARNKITNDFLSKAIATHGDRYCYREVSVLNLSAAVTIFCKIHGEFKESPSHHIGEGGGCPKCEVKLNSNTLSNDDFIRKAVSVHGEKYDYSNSDYNGHRGDVKIICKTHGEFTQNASNHLRGYGCPDCCTYGYNKNAKGYLYILRHNTKSIFKVGISNKPKLRIQALRRNTPFDFDIVGIYSDADGKKALSAETKMHQMFESAKLSGFDGATEWLIADGSIIDVPLKLGLKH